MLFNSYSFLIFFPIVVLVSFLIPKKVQHIWLLCASYFFYMNWDAKYVLLLLFSTVITYLSGICIDKIRKGRETSADIVRYKEKIVVAVSFVLNLLLLFIFKYLYFTIDSLNLLLGQFSLALPNPSFSIILPVGISFYIFQALSYTMDIYRSEIQVERSFFRYALFVSFFPQLVAGPIERSKNLLRQVNEVHRFNYDNMRDGLLIMIWGYFMKLVIADRAAIVVDTVYGDISAYGGIYLLIATVLFAVQIYCDFAGYSLIAIGAAEILGFRLMENFNCPYFSASIGEFWRRWHISLSTWFRDYLYIPLGGNRKGTLRKYLNLLIVMLVSGLWHGASGTFVIWGGLHGIYQVLGDILRPIRDYINKFFGLKKEALSHKLVCGAFIFGLVDFAWIFFRAGTFKEAVEIIKGIFHMNISMLSVDGLTQLGLDWDNIKLLVLAIIILFIADIFKYNGVQLRKIIFEQELWFRWICYIGAVLFVLIFGVWGGTYDASSFIYFQF